MTRPIDPSTIDAIAVDVVRSGLPFDVCCPHALTAHGSAGRCQLWAGHGGDHAVMFVRAGERTVCTWTGPEPTGVHLCAAYRGLPWARGFPLPAWHEDAPDVAASHPGLPSG